MKNLEKITLLAASLLVASPAVAQDNWGEVSKYDERNVQMSMVELYNHLTVSWRKKINNQKSLEIKSSFNGSIKNSDQRLAFYLICNNIKSQNPFMVREIAYGKNSRKWYIDRNADKITEKIVTIYPLKSRPRDYNTPFWKKYIPDCPKLIS